MAFKLVIDDPDDPGTPVEAYVRLVLNNRPRPGLGLGLHAEFAAYRSQSAANKPGARPLCIMAMDIPEDVYAARLWDERFSPSALDPAWCNPDAAVYAYAAAYEPQFAGAVPIFEPGQVPLEG